MNAMVDLVVFGTFGTPNGFTQSSWLKKNIYRTFDLNTNAIGLYSKTTLYSVRKEISGENIIVSYSIYTFAKEKHSERGGTFIGSNISFSNRIANESLVVKTLNEFHQDLISNKLNIVDDVIQVGHSNKLITNKLKDFNKINFQYRQIEDLDSVQSSNKNLVVYSLVQPKALQNLFKKSIDLLNIYDTIYFTSSNEIAEFVIQKGLFKLVKEDGLEKEIQSLQAEKEHKIQMVILDFEKEMETLEIEKKNFIDDFKKKIENNETLHDENKRKIDEAKKNLNLINEKYDVYAKTIDDAIVQIKLSKKLNTITRSHRDNKKTFTETVSQLSSQNFITPISDTNVKLESRNRHRSTHHESYTSYNSPRHENPQDHKLPVFKVAFIILLILWLSTLAYFIFFNAAEKYTILNINRKVFLSLN